MTTSSGRSPRTRGSPQRDDGVLVVDGSIPAYAGEPSCSRSDPCRRRVDPRVRGGAEQDTDCPMIKAGRSPRTRGSLEKSKMRLLILGSIPAYAGEPSRHYASSCSCWVDPRVRGGAKVSSGIAPPEEGRSPRTRGSRAELQRRIDAERSIPAYAGEPCWRWSY